MSPFNIFSIVDVVLMLLMKVFFLKMRLPELIVLITILGFALSITISSAQPIKADYYELWDEYKATYHKLYVNEKEETLRREIFLSNYALVSWHNYDLEKGVYSYALSINKYADVTPWEYQNSMKGLNMNQSTSSRTKRDTVDDTNPPFIPESVNWLEEGAVTAVKDQGICAACYAFSSMGALEAANFIQQGHLVDLSEQEILDCTWSYGNMGCAGGLMDNAFDYVIEEGNVATDAAYPYVATDTGECMHNDNTPHFSISAYIDLPSGDEIALAGAVAFSGPVACGICSNPIEFLLYSSGIYDNQECNGYDMGQLDHALLVVGYGTENGQDYWLAKNSWGTSWGMDGYIMIARNDNNVAGLALLCSYPV